uniref:Uncharacterized protein n=1 Tax=Anguilla anguilla TaxID=7936 RepID=A0A0E9TA12_ANGAN
MHLEGYYKLFFIKSFSLCSPQETFSNDMYPQCCNI